MVVLLCTFIFTPSFVFAVDIGGETGSGITLDNPLGVSTITGLIDAIIDFLIEIGAVLLVIIVLIGAYQMLFAVGNPEKFATGKKTIIYAVIGYAIILLAKGIELIIDLTEEATKTFNIINEDSEEEEGEQKKAIGLFHLTC